jgi:hypothetical protein
MPVRPWASQICHSPVTVTGISGRGQSLRRGDAIYRDQAGTPIESDPPQVAGKIPPLNLKARAAESGQGIVVISDMHHAVAADGSVRFIKN